MSASPGMLTTPTANRLERADGFHVSRTHFPGWAIPAGHLLLFWRCLRRIGMLRNSMVRLVFLRQVYFDGVTGLRLNGLLALAIGGLAVTPATNLLGANNNYLYEILGWGLVTEAAPLVVAMVFIGRNAMVISTELALMRVRGELRFLEQMGIDPRDYLVLPRILAFMVSLLAVTFYYQVISVTGGFAVSSLLLNVSFTEQMRLLLEAISPVGVLFSALKALIFGLVIGTIACFSGLFAGDTINDVPRAQIVAYMRSLIWLVAIDLLFALATL